MTVSKRRSAAMIGIAAAAGLACGTGAWALAAQDSNSASPAKSSQAPAPPLAPVDYPTNASGVTYGEHKLGTEAPELLEAETDDGKPGYVFVRDLQGPGPASSPEEGARQTRERLNDKGEIIIPVYAVDGKTKIGTFLAGRITTGDKAGE